MIRPFFAPPNSSACFLGEDNRPPFVFGFLDMILTVIDPDADKDNQKPEYVGDREDSKLIIESPNIWYLVGLIASDGYLSSDGRHIDITSIDYEFLKGVRDLFGGVGRNDSNGPPITFTYNSLSALSFNVSSFFCSFVISLLHPTANKTSNNSNNILLLLLIISPFILYSCYNL